MTRSAGILLSRAARAEVLLGHMGGPYWARKDERAWSIPKGEIDDAESDLEAARREFVEELGIPAPDAPYQPLGEFRQRSGKVVVVFHAEADIDIAGAVSNEFELEWPPRSGRIQRFPEFDRIRWVPVGEARRLLVAGQVDALEAIGTSS